jgi:C-terminal processing protease CtpA/Prc
LPENLHLLRPSRARLLRVVALVCCLNAVAGSLQTVRSQTISKADREHGREMLSTIKDDLKKQYYDPTFRGLDIDALFKAADERIKQATSVGQMLGIIAQALMSLNDSHTFFLPPTQTVHVDYGWQMQMIGDKCYVVEVKAGSDAEARGLKVGDLVRSVEGIEPTRESLWKILYLFDSLRPQNGLRIVVQSGDKEPRRMDAAAKVWQDKQRITLYGTFTDPNSDYIRERKRERQSRRDQTYAIGNDVFIWKMPSFNTTDEKIDDMMNKVRKHQALILDLRGNPGGRVTALKRLVSHLFDHEVKIAVRKGRVGMESHVVKPRDENVFKGKLVVLVDSDSASASEVFARLVQLEKRGTVVGDRTSGAVMESLRHSHEIGTTDPGSLTKIFYGVSITYADLIMSDGKSLERVGVMPDTLLLPTAADLAAGRDPVLSHAGSLLGMAIDPEKAGGLFPEQ